MIFISDILLNFIDGDRVYEFFEWEKDDSYEHIRKIPLFRVSTKELEDMAFNKVLINDTKFKLSIKDKTEVFKTGGVKVLPYTFLLTDAYKVIGIELDSKGNIISKSTLLLDEEEEILEISNELEEISIKYQKNSINLSKINTRKEEFIKKVLLQDIKYAYLEKDYYKLKYLYNELYNDNVRSIKFIYNKLINDINNNFSNKHYKIFNILIKNENYL